MQFDLGLTGKAGRPVAGHGQSLMTLWRWWWDTIGAMAPSQLREAFFPSRRWVVVSPDADGLVVHSTSGTIVGKLDESAKARRMARNGDVLLAIDEADVFLRQRRLPAGSLAHMKDALRLQISADTPFEIDEVYTDSRIVEPASEGGQVVAEQAILMRSTVDELIAQLRSHRLEPAGVDVLRSDGNCSGFNMLPENQRMLRSGLLPSLNRGLLLAAVLLAVAGGILHIVRMGQIESALDTEISQVSAGAKEVLALQQQLRQRAQAVSILQDDTSSPLRFTTFYNNLAARLPRDAWLEGLTFDGTQASLVGLSRSSDSLVGQLEATPGVASARVVSSMVRDPRLEADRFRIELMLDATSSLAEEIE